MRASNSPRPFRATSSSLLALVFSSIVLTSVFLAGPVSTRSVADSREIGATDHGVIGENSNHGISKRDHVEKDEKLPPVAEIGTPIEQPQDVIGKSSVNSVKSKQEEGIRRFDAVVASEEAVEKNAGKEEKRVESSEIGKTVIKGIIVRDAPIDSDGINVFPELVLGVDEPSGVKANRKRSLADPKLASEPVVVEGGEPSAAKEIIEAVSDASERIADSAESRQVPVLIPVGSSHAKLRRAEKVPVAEASVVQEKENVADLVSAKEPGVDAPAETAKEEIVRTIPELTQAHEKSVASIPVSDESAKKEEIVVPELKKIVIHEDGLGEVDDTLEIGKAVLSARKSLPISEESEKDQENEERVVRSEAETKIGQEIPPLEVIKESVEDKEVPLPLPVDNSYSASLSSIMKTNESLEALKAQAMSLQNEIKDKIYLQKLREQAIEVLPGIPKFTEIQLLDSLMAISSLKKLDVGDEESSYLSKMDTSILNDSQLQILRSSESLLSREQRQTFAENLMECIRSFDILNCMRIFVWPIIADNLPENLVQNLPTLPIEINVSDFLPGNQQDKPKAEQFRSSSSPHQQRLITPELVVSSILKDALNANPIKIGDALPTFIDPQNETLSKLLTPGQLEILKMAEKFLPESSRQEFSNRMFSCVRRFEYFSCVKYFAWPMVKQHYPPLPDFPDYQSWYPSITLYPGYPILPYPNTEGIGELPEVVEADATRTRRPRPEAVIVQILENTLRQIPGHPQTYQSRQPANVLATVTPDQMAIFYTAQQFLPVQLRADFMAKTMECIKEYDYLTCTKYSTWPTIRQFWPPNFPSFPQFPDISSLIPTFAIPELPDLSQYIPDFGSLFPGLPTIPGFPGGSKPEPETEPQPQPQPIPDKPPQEMNVTIIETKEERVAASASPIENRIIQILSNIRWIPLARNAQPIPSVTPDSIAVLRMLTYNQLRILGMAKNAIPLSVRGDLDSRFVGCLQGGSDFISCTKNVIWPTLQLYVKNMPSFPEEEAKPTTQKIPEANFSEIKPGVYQPDVERITAGQFVYAANSGQIAGRSPISGQIVAEPEESAIPVSPPQSGSEIPQGALAVQNPVASLRQGISPKSSDPTIPVISVTDTRFTPIFSDHPETVLLKILTTIQASSKYADNSYANLEKPGYIESLNDYLNADQKSVIRISENLLPDEVKSDFVESVKGCVTKSNFIVCSRDIIWPSLSQYYQRLPSFPNFYINDSIEKVDADALAASKPILPGPAAISETNVKTGQHGDAMVTITDTRFVPIFSHHPEAVILSILRNVQASSPNLLAQPGATKIATRSSDFIATFTDQQGNIVTVAENLLPESIREVFTKRMSECVKENSFLACTRDIAWPTIAQFIPRLPNFPNIGALPDFAIEKPQPPVLLPPQLGSAKPSLAPGLAIPSENLVPIAPQDAESRIEATLKQISSPRRQFQPEFSYLDMKDPVVASRVTERQANVIRLIEGMLPPEVKPILVGHIVDCRRANDFPNCVGNHGWPILRQYVPDLPDFPDFGSYYPPELPQIPQIQIPQIPQFPGFQIPEISQIPQFPSLDILRRQAGYPFPAAQSKIAQNAALIHTAQLQSQPGGVSGHGIQGLTPSVESAPSTVDPSTPESSGPSPVVPESSPKPTDLLSDVPSEGRRKRRHIDEEPPANYQDISSNNIGPQLHPNITESESLKTLINVTKIKEENTKGPEDIVEALNSTMKASLTSELIKIHKAVEDISSQPDQGFVSKVIQCFRGRRFIRCIGILVWPFITQNLPSLLPYLGSLKPLGKSSEGIDSFKDIFGMTIKEFEMEMLEKKQNVEKILVDWYRGVVENKYDNNYGFLRVQGYGDGEIGISFNSFKRKGRGAKIKDSKNMPSILTIISEIMEDVLDQRESKPERKDHGKRYRSLREEDDDNRVYYYPERHVDSQRSTNDDQIISMFLEKIKVNSSSDIGGSGGSDGNRYLSIEDAYKAFELLFGTRLSEMMAERLHNLDKNQYHVLSEEKPSDLSRQFHGTSVNKSEEDSQKIAVDTEESTENDGNEEKKIRSGLILRLPKIDEEFPSRKITSRLVELGRKTKMQMSQIVPGLTFLISFFVQMALAHARAAASVAGMMSNMALGSAVMSMIRQTFFGSMGHPKVKHVYDNEAIGPGITWPHHNYHG